MRIHRLPRRLTLSSVPHRVCVMLVLTLLVACGGGKGTPTAPPASATLAATPTTGSASPTGAAPETPDASAPAGVPAASAAPIVATVASSGSPTPAGTGTAGTPGAAATAAQTTVVAGTTLAARTQSAGTASVNVTAQVGIGTAAVATTAAGGTVPRFAAAACPFKLGPGEVDGQNVACGYLVVPEEHAHPAGRTIWLAVATVKSVGAQPAPEPIIVLNGGPGQGSEGFLAGFLSDRLPLKALLDRYTVVFFDQRGTGYSQPSLACPDAGGATPGGAIAAMAPTEQELAVPIKCHDRLVGTGVNLSAYNSAESAADVNDLRTALRYDQVNLLGISYGTRLALTVLRDFPQIVRSTVIGSVDPPQEDLLADRTTSFDGALKRVFVQCAADPACDSKYPDLQATFAQDVAQLNDNPVTLTVKNPTTGKTQTGRATGRSLISAVYLSLFLGSYLAPTVPILIAQVHDGQYALLTALLGLNQTTASDISIGMYYSVQCSEQYAFSTPDGVKNAAATAQPEIRELELPAIANDLAVCGKWGVAKADAREKQAVRSDVPTLLLSGQYDPITPPSYAQDAAKTLSRGMSVEFPGIGHDPVTTSGACGESIILGFFQQPLAQPNTACTAALTPKLGTAPKLP